MILLVSHADDPHAAEVQRRLQLAGADVVLFDTASVPSGVRLTVQQVDGADWQSTMRLAGGAIVDLADVHVAWWRRPLPFELHPEMTDADDRAFAYGECHAAVSGLWSCLDATWINDPDRDQIASRKMLQLEVATELGLRTPRTCITNDPEEARRFVAREGVGATIYKSFSATEQAWRETRLLRPGEDALLDNVRFAPVIFQQHIAATVDLRITIVGDELFAAEIHSQQTPYVHDFRMAMDEAEMRPHRLPDSVTKELHSLMDALGLIYGAVDMRLTPDGEYVFLEVNPAGQWLFVEARTEQPITQALCDLMVRCDL